ncbi:hypothetical protein NM688_g5648 [Phlebia brevispora]|uniref:Uncharacterized protein n=1 Tax=Phlebia brevispora TaxID=194682 RepID=A0ACC1SSC8_9APHY|nr:hypothetical protein NM688_g5648 [Phlebia brevispora]
MRAEGGSTIADRLAFVRKMDAADVRSSGAKKPGALEVMTCGAPAMRAESSVIPGAYKNTMCNLHSGVAVVAFGGSITVLRSENVHPHRRSPIVLDGGAS